MHPAPAIKRGHALMNADPDYTRREGQPELVTTEDLDAAMASVAAAMDAMRTLIEAGFDKVLARLDEPGDQ